MKLELSKRNKSSRMSDPQARSRHPFEEQLEAREKVPPSSINSKVVQLFVSHETGAATARAVLIAFLHLQAQDGCTPRISMTSVLLLRLQFQKSQSRRSTLLRSRSSTLRR